MLRAKHAVLLGCAAAACAAALVARRPRRLRLKGQVALITGGSRGLGLSIARELARRGTKLVLFARHVDELREARDELASTGAEVLALGCDVTDRAQVSQAVSRALERFGKIDILVNDAGVIEVGGLEDMCQADFELAMSTHFGGALHLVYEVVPQMMARRSGRVVNIASIGGLTPVPHLAPYCASKFALVGFSEALRVELGSSGIAVTTVCPGLMRTGSGGAAWFKGDVRAENAWFRVSSIAPLLTMSAERAARRIVLALERGEGRVVLGAPAKLAALAYGLMPNVTGSLLSSAARALRKVTTDASGGPAVRGASLPLPGPWLQRRDDRLAREHNERHARVSQR